MTTPSTLFERMIRLLSPFIEDNDRDLSDAEFIYRLKKRFDLDWNKRQALIDPAE